MSVRSLATRILSGTMNAEVVVRCNGIHTSPPKAGSPISDFSAVIQDTSSDPDTGLSNSGVISVTASGAFGPLSCLLKPPKISGRVRSSQQEEHLWLPRIPSPLHLNESSFRQTSQKHRNVL